MASDSAVQPKTNFFHFPFQAKLEKQKQQRAGLDTFEASKKTKLTRLSGEGRPQALTQGDEPARKGGLLDCFGILGLLALCCVCCEGSGNGGYGRGRYYGNKPKGQLNNPPPAPRNDTAPPAVV